MTLNPNERELLAQFFGVAIVGLDVDRALEEELLVRGFSTQATRPFRAFQAIVEGRDLRRNEAIVFMG